MDRNVDTTTGSLTRSIVSLAIPIVVSRIIHVSYNLIDSFWIGQLGQPAISALFFSWPIIFLMISLAGGITAAGSIMIAQAFGDGDSVERVAGQLFIVVAALSVIFTVTGYISMPMLLKLVGTPPGTELFIVAVKYTRIVFVGLPFYFIFMAFQAIYQGRGDTRIPMYILAVSIGLNTVLDPILIYGLPEALRYVPFYQSYLMRVIPLTFEGAGITGAAVATVLSRVFASIIGLGMLYNNEHFSISMRCLIPRGELIRELLSTGTPIVVERGLQSLGVVALTAITAMITPTTVAALGLGNRILSILSIPALSAEKGTQIAVGQNWGAGNRTRARQTMIEAGKIIVLVSLVLASLTYVFAGELIQVFVDGPNTHEIIATGEEFLRLLAPTLVFADAFHIIAGGIRGTGNTYTPLLISVIGLWVFRIAPAYLAVAYFNIGSTGIWYAIAASNVLLFSLGLVYILSNGLDSEVTIDAHFASNN